jgi:tripeptide aminopeptidase
MMNYRLLTIPFFLFFAVKVYNQSNMKNSIEIPTSITDDLERKVTERFIRYVQMHTTSDENSKTFPSTAGQFDLAGLVRTELEEIGLKEIELDENGYLMATLPSNTDKEVETMGFLAHFDTSPEVDGDNVKPVFHMDYDGSDIVINKKENIVLSQQEYPELKEYTGHNLITSDGTTLLGADDKSGIAAIVTAMEYLVQHPEIKHGKIMLCFTPDEEIGRGVDRINLRKFNPDFAYTIDGGGYGTVEYENFNAAGVKITIKGKNVHPGYAKNKMINSISIANQLDNLLPRERPENTEMYEGYFHLYKMEGDVEETKMEYLIRDHNSKRFQKRKKLMQSVVDSLNNRYGEGTVLLDMKDSYYNMSEKIRPVMHIVDLAKKAIKETGIEPMVLPIRGGTDGARLSYMGIPCPNLSAGGMNFHSRYEYISTEAMNYTTEMIIRLAQLNK